MVVRIAGSTADRPEDADRRRTRRISVVLLSLVTISLASGTVATLVSGPSAERVPLGPYVASLLPVLVACAVSVALTYSRRLRIAQVFQFVLFLGGGYLTIALNETLFASSALFVLAVFLGLRYGLFDRHPMVKVAILLGLLVAALGVSIRTFGRESASGIMGFIVFLAVYGLLWYFVAEQEIRDLMARSRTAEQSLRRHKKDIDIGRSAIGVFHGMSGRMMAMENAIRAVEKNGADGKAIARLREAQSGIAQILANIKLSVVHQSTEEQVQLRLGDLLKGLLETFRAECDTAGRHIEIGLDLREDAVVEARPVDLYTMFENVARNALEAGATRFVATVAPGRTVVLADNGPGIRACRECAHHECMGCELFHEGRTGKQGGSGIGMVFVRDTMARYGRLRIQSSDQGTEMSFTFATPGPS